MCRQVTFPGFPTVSRDLEVKLQGHLWSRTQAGSYNSHHRLIYSGKFMVTSSRVKAVSCDG